MQRMVELYQDEAFAIPPRALIIGSAEVYENFEIERGLEIPVMRKFIILDIPDNN